VVHEQILEQMKEEEAAEGKGARMVENGDNNQGDDGDENTNLAYDAEQREIRRAFLESTGYDNDAAGDDNGDGDVDNDRAKGIGDDDNDDDEDWIKPKAKKTSIDIGADDDLAKKLWEVELRLQNNTPPNNGDALLSASPDDDGEDDGQEGKRNRRKRKKDKEQPSLSSSVRKPLADPKGKIEDGDKFLLEFFPTAGGSRGK
jgi:hypothetical protein